MGTRDQREFIGIWDTQGQRENHRRQYIDCEPLLRRDRDAQGEETAERWDVAWSSSSSSSDWSCNAPLVLVRERQGKLAICKKLSNLKGPKSEKMRRGREPDDWFFALASLNLGSHPVRVFSVMATLGRAPRIARGGEP